MPSRADASLGERWPSLNAARVFSMISRGRRWKSCLFSSAHRSHIRHSQTSVYGTLPQTPEFSEWGRMAPGKACFPRSAVPILGAYRTFRTTRVALQQSPIRSGGGPNEKHRRRGCQRSRRTGEGIQFCSDKFCPVLLSSLQSLRIFLARISLISRGRGTGWDRPDCGLC